MNYSYVLKKLNKNYPVKYIELINRIVNSMISIFDDNLITIVLGGSGGKGNIIDGWSDIDLYVILKTYNVDEIIGYPCPPVDFTENMFESNYFDRSKNFTLDMLDENTPYTRNWTLQTIDFFNTSIGWAIYDSNQLNFGFTEETRITDDASYQRLKDNPDSWTTDIAYARYNHDSAVRTIKSLPDCSASGGINTIKFNGSQGSKTDGGAISNLTEEEIAVATAKGWTVSFV